MKGFSGNGHIDGTAKYQRNGASLATTRAPMAKVLGGPYVMNRVGTSSLRRDMKDELDLRRMASI
jgi:hypothetical protein